LQNFEEFEAPPSAASLIESMRDFGYTLETAIADIVDNSITAGASRIWIMSSDQDGPMRIGIIDDGKGMAFDELKAAMRPGSRNPLEERSPSDLGRFGLGLKTASFSQCRRMTVVTRQAGVTAAACWDLDLVQARDKWVLQIPSDIDDIPWLEMLPNTGTMVLWESIDRFDGEHTGGDLAGFSSYLNRRLSEVLTHLELVFHRFLAGEKGLKKVKISFNNRALEAFDPFNSTHPATFRLPLEEIHLKAGSGVTKVDVQAYVLPYFKKAGKEEWEKFAGEGGYLKNQGFYVYREKRLILHGTWFGLARKKASTQLARVRIDISNELDNEWKIDVKKASAQLPFPVRSRLRQILVEIESKSKQPIIGRGYVTPTFGASRVWQREELHGNINYAVNSSHPVIDAFLNDLDSLQSASFRRVLQLISASLPVDPIFSDLGSNPEKVRGAIASEDTLEYSLRVLVERMSSSGLDEESIRSALEITPPFNDSLDFTKQFLDQWFEIGI